jgi:hypothetical protein
MPHDMDDSACSMQAVVDASPQLNLLLVLPPRHNASDVVGH